MNNLTVFEQNGQLLTYSREVAMMVGKDHAKLLRDIREYCKHLNESNFGWLISSSNQLTRIQREK